MRTSSEPPPSVRCLPSLQFVTLHLASSAVLVIVCRLRIIPSWKVAGSSWGPTKTINIYQPAANELVQYPKNGWPCGEPSFGIRLIAGTSQPDEWCEWSQAWPTRRGFESASTSNSFRDGVQLQETASSSMETGSCWVRIQPGWVLPSIGGVREK